MRRDRRTRPGALAAGIAALVVACGLIAPAPAFAASTGTPDRATSVSSSSKAPSTAPGGKTPSAATLRALATAQQHAHDTSVAAPCSATPKSPAGKIYAHCLAVIHANGKRQIQQATAGPIAGALTPADIQNAYDLPSGGSGETIGLVEAYNDPSAEADLAKFRSQYGLPACTTANGCLTEVNENGGSQLPVDDTSWSLETSLDLDAVSSACPECKILMVEAQTPAISDLAPAVDTAVRLGAVAVSNSYGVPEGDQPGQLSLDQHYDHPGVAITVSSGDTGNVLNWPASNPDVTSVGGTTLTKDGGNARGWDESAWVEGGSGCSAVEPRPATQQNITTDCPDNRAVADISAVGDPTTGLSVYDSVGYDGWLQVGGTSLSSPLVASMYALAGTPAANTYPVSYLYNDPQRAADINDITTGVDGTCGDLLCQAGTGWDGPTGLGSPEGVAAFTLGANGNLSGTVDSAAGPIAGAAVTATDTGTGYAYTTTTTATGAYVLPVRSGRTYDLAFSDFGYQEQQVSGISVAQGATVTNDPTLTALPTSTVSGKVTDGSGHGYPMYARITVDGYPSALYTNPATGEYSVSLPQGETYTMHIQSAALPGYTNQTTQVAVAASAVTQNVALPVDQTTCTAPGYAFQQSGPTETFDDWTNGPADGWTVTDDAHSGVTWETDDPAGLGNETGGSGGFAAVEAYIYFNATEDTSLVSPVTDLSADADPVIDFDTDYEGVDGQVGDVDLSTDGGTTWNTVWEQTSANVQGNVEIPIPQAANASDVRVRFRYTGTWEYWWEIDNVLIGSRTCAPTPAGLVVGRVADRNTGDGIDGATIGDSAGNGSAATSATSVATPDDAAEPDGLYWMLTTPGTHQLSAADGNYSPGTAQVTVTADEVTTANWSLAAGRLARTPASTSVTEQIGGTKQTSVTYTNTGTAPLHIQLGEAADPTIPLAHLAPAATTKQLVPGTFTPAAFAHPAGKPSAGAKSLQGTPAATPTSALKGTAAGDPAWSPIADYPTPVMDNEAVSGNGTVYSVDGYDGTATVAHGYSYDPSAGAWNPIADAPAAVEAPAGGFADGRVYMVAGWDTVGDTTSGTYAYDPSTDTWSTAADLPESVSAAAGAVLDGKLYIVGGCATASCAITSDKVYSFDPSTGAWTNDADYPVTAAFLGCAGVDGKIVCAGGTNGPGLTDTYIYDPVTNTWSQGANMPYDDWGMAYAGSDGTLQVAGGVTQSGQALTNQAEQYDPAANLWTPLPDVNIVSERGGSACGMYKVGGYEGGGDYIAASEMLPDEGGCGDANGVAWLTASQSALTLAPGQSQTVDVTLDASAVNQPGTYQAELTTTTDSPYATAATDLTMNVTAPKSWGKVAVTVTDAATGQPIPGATVTICTMYAAKTGACGPVTFTLRTDGAGQTQWWLDKGYNPLNVVVSKDGYSSVLKVAKITAGGTLQLTFALTRAAG